MVTENSFFNLEIEDGLGITHDLYVNFPIWVLMHEGILVPPFDKHEPKDSALAKLGFDAISWYNWLKMIVISQEWRRCLQCIDIEATIAEKISQVKEYVTSVYPLHDIPIDNINWELAKTKLRLKLEYENNLYQQFLEDCAGIDINNIHDKVYEPHLFLSGNTAIKEYITQLWSEFCPNARSYMLMDDYLHDPNLFFHNWNNPRYKPICCLQHWVSYPYPIQYPITRESIIIAVPPTEALNKDKIWQYCTDAIELMLSSHN